MIVGCCRTRAKPTRPSLNGEGAADRWSREPDPALHVIAHVFKVTQDPYVGKMGIFRIHQGITATASSTSGTGDVRSRSGHLFVLQGKEHVGCRARSGRHCAVAKIDDMHFDAVLTTPRTPHPPEPALDFPTPVHGLAIEPKRRGDEQRAVGPGAKLVGGPCLKVEHVVATNETVIYGLGEIHLRMVLERLTEVYKCEGQHAAAADRHRRDHHPARRGATTATKQTGGAGQFGEVFLRIEPLPARRRLQFPRPGQGGTIPGSSSPPSKGCGRSSTPA